MSPLSVCYLISAILFILGLKGLSSPRTMWGVLVVLFDKGQVTRQSATDRVFLTVKQAAEVSGLGSSTIRLVVRSGEARSHPPRRPGKIFGGESDKGKRKMRTEQDATAKDNRDR